MLNGFIQIISEVCFRFDFVRDRWASVSRHCMALPSIWWVCVAGGRIADVVILDSFRLTCPSFWTKLVACWASHPSAPWTAAAAPSLVRTPSSPRRRGQVGGPVVVWARTGNGRAVSGWIERATVYCGTFQAFLALCTDRLWCARALTCSSRWRAYSPQRWQETRRVVVRSAGMRRGGRRSGMGANTEANRAFVVRMYGSVCCGRLLVARTGRRRRPDVSSEGPLERKPSRPFPACRRRPVRPRSEPFSWVCVRMYIRTKDSLAIS